MNNAETMWHRKVPVVTGRMASFRHDDGKPRAVTEERVLQLIYDHVPGLIRLTLADILGDVSTKLTATDDEEC